MQDSSSIFRIRSYGEVTSTNDLVKRAIDAGAPEGEAVCARVQTAGYGRQGRSWSSPAGGLYLSVLLRPDVPPAQLPTLSLVVGIAVRRALIRLTGSDDIQLKWPNDVVLRHPDPTCPENAPWWHKNPSNRRIVARRVDPVDPDREELPALGRAQAADRQRLERDPSTRRVFVPAGAEKRESRHLFCKLCGISTEAHGGAVCVGIGVNVAQSGDAAHAVGGKNTAISVQELTDGAVSLEQVRDAVLREIGECYAVWQDAGFGAFVEEYDRAAALAGREVRVERADGSLIVQGAVQRVDAAGALIVRDVQGCDVPVISGEAHIASA